ncbi:MAG: twin-arginine translocation signal domain-containing protein [Beijerinckiaceae bacterium]
MKAHNRRDFLIATGALAVTGAVSTDAWTRRAFAQKSETVGSE